MSSLSFPDVNVWLALATPEHVHHAIAANWWNQVEGAIAFCRFSQLGFLRLVTTAAAMDNKPLTMGEAWRAYDRFFDDDRVSFVGEAPDVESLFRKKATGRTVSPKIWADAWLLATAEAAGGKLVTFDRALYERGAIALSSAG
jgi:toxin-antitoxin system PIN domain toxin